MAAGIIIIEQEMGTALRMGAVLNYFWVCLCSVIISINDFYALFIIDASKILRIPSKRSV
jgi:hypothetical protein